MTALISRLFHSPLWLLAVVAAASVAANLATFEIVDQISGNSITEHVAFESVIVLALQFPILLFLFFRPLVKQIGERQKAEEVVKRREHDFRTLAENSPDLIIRFDRNLRYLYVNPAITAITGIPAPEFIGKSGTELRLEDFLTPIWEAKARQVIASGERLTFEFAVKTPRGEAIMEAGLAPEFDGSGAVDTVLAISRDITARRKIEKRLRSYQERLRALSVHQQRAREEERNRIAREIHDELGQVLATVRMGVSLLEIEHRDPAALSAKMLSLDQLVADAIRTVQRITAELRPQMLDVLGLAEAIEWQAKEFQNRTGIGCRTKVQLQREYQKDVATALFRIFQETLTNVIRHSGADHVEVTLKERKGRLVLMVRDNGRGITREQLEGPQSFGIIGMKERGHAFGGRIWFFGAPGKGTAVIAIIPIAAEERASHPCRLGTASAS